MTGQSVKVNDIDSHLSISGAFKAKSADTGYPGGSSYFTLLSKIRLSSLFGGWKKRSQKRWNKNARNRSWAVHAALPGPGVINQ